jgi:hypothetical protein
MVYSIVFTDRSVSPYAVTLITGSGVVPDFDGAQDMQYSHATKLNTQAIDTNAIRQSGSGAEIPKQSLVVYYQGHPSYPNTTNSTTETLNGPWTIEKCVDLLKRLNEGSVVLLSYQTTFQQIKLLVLPPKGELSKAIRKCILEISEAQAIIDKATTTLDTINTDA